MEQANGYKPIPPFTNPLAKEVGTKTHKDMRKLAPVLLMSPKNIACLSMHPYNFTLKSEKSVLSP
jgi:hypothetical protein